MQPTMCTDAAPAAPPDGADAHLKAMLGWLHRLLTWEIARTRLVFGALAEDDNRGLYIPDAEVDILCAGPPDLPPALQDVRMELDDERAALAAIAAGHPSSLIQIQHLFGLSPFDCDVLLLALAPELDLHYERIYGYIQDDITKRRPTVNLALRMLCADPREQTAARQAFAPDAPLLRHRLVTLLDDGPHTPLLARAIKLDERIVSVLLGLPALDPQLVPFVARCAPIRAFGSLCMPDELLVQARAAFARRDDGLVLALHGSYGSGRLALAEALCAAAGMPLLTINVDRLLESSGNPAELAQRITRAALLHGAALLWQGASRLFEDESAGPWRAAVLDALDALPGCAFLVLDRPWEARGQLRHSRFLQLDLPPLSYAGREQLWQRYLGDAEPDAEILRAIASTFRLSGGQIRDAAALARTLVAWRGDNSRPTRQDLYVACRAQSSGKLDSLARKVAPTYTWNDIVLPTDQMVMLNEICMQVRHRRTVLERWGFDAQLAMGKGVNVLVAGPSGTGKTMAAEIIAAELGLELYKVNLATMVSKYIGETEKNLDRIFTAAREANAILFFDEADSIFGKRSEVKDAQDRYANIEVGYLLQKIEEYDGVVMLATNLRKNMDDAFVRRLHVAIDFPFPEEADRLHIWQKVFPAAAPLADDVDLAFVARQFKLAGGNIRNVALLSAFLAAEEGETIGMQHIVRATKREYQKLGKLVHESDFGPYMALFRSA